MYLLYTGDSVLVTVQCTYYMTFNLVYIVHFPLQSIIKCMFCSLRCTNCKLFATLLRVDILKFLKKLRCRYQVQCTICIFVHHMYIVPGVQIECSAHFQILLGHMVDTYKLYHAGESARQCSAQRVIHVQLHILFIARLHFFVHRHG